MCVALCRKHLIVWLYSCVHPHTMYEISVTLWTLKKYFHKHLDAWRLLFVPFHRMRFSHMAVWKPEAKWRREKQDDGIIEKDSQKVKERRTSSTRDRETGRLKCKYSQKTEREIDNEGYLPFIWIWVIYSITFSFPYVVLTAPVEFTVGLVWSITVSLPISHNISFGVAYTWVKFTEKS